MRRRKSKYYFRGFFRYSVVASVRAARTVKPLLLVCPGPEGRYFP
jgi:hypothetical protein